jgi:hypothetical protein
MSVCVYSVFMLFYMQVAALRRADPRSRIPTDCKKSRNWKCGWGSTKRCRAIDRYWFRDDDFQMKYEHNRKHLLQCDLCFNDLLKRIRTYTEEYVEMFQDDLTTHTVVLLGKIFLYSAM